MVLEQLLYSGVLESIEIRKAGYAMRLPFLEFFQRYRIIIKGSDKLAQAGVREDRGGGGHPARPVDDGQQQDLPQDHGRGAAAGADGYQSEDDVGEDNPRSRALLHLLRQVPADEEGRGLHQPQGQGLCAARALPAPAAERRVYPGARARLTDEKPDPVIAGRWRRAGRRGPAEADGGGGGPPEGGAEGAGGHKGPAAGRRGRRGRPSPGRRRHSSRRRIAASEGDQSEPPRGSGGIGAHRCDQ